MSTFNRKLHLHETLCKENRLIHTKLSQQQRKTRIIRNVPVCAYTGYLKNPKPEEVTRLKKHFLLRYGMISSGITNTNYKYSADLDLKVCLCCYCVFDINPSAQYMKTLIAYPASLPAVPVHLRDNPTWKTLPSAPDLYWLPIRNEAKLEFKWDLPRDRTIAKIKYFQVYYYHEVPNKKYTSNSWNKLMDIKYSRLELDEFLLGGKCHFSVRAVDEYNRRGPFSDPITMFLTYN